MTLFAAVANFMEPATHGAPPTGRLIDMQQYAIQKVVARGPGEADTFHKSLVAGSIQACSVLNFSEKQITLYQMALVPRALKAQVNLQGVGDRTLGEIRRISGSKIPHARSLLQQASDAEDDERRKRRRFENEIAASGLAQSHHTRTSSI